METAERTATAGGVIKGNLNDVCRLLNQLVGLEIEPEEPVPGPGEITSLAIRPYKW